ncbi:flagellar protein FlaG [Ectothiorhodospiraceae bacterium BW-2]|nr:flagellar protein FlaG [Ectothiorhodospiraceae bacterium BW-2]
MISAVTESVSVQNFTPHQASTAGRVSAESKVTAEAKVGSGNDRSGIDRLLERTRAEQKQDEKGDRTQDDLSSILSELDSYVQKVRSELQFLRDNDNGSMVIKVVNSETNEVIRQIPSEEIQQLHKRLDEAAGIIIRAKA